MAVFEYDTLDLPGIAALDPAKTISDAGLTLTSEEIVAAGGALADTEAEDSTNGED